MKTPKSSIARQSLSKYVKSRRSDNKLHNTLAARKRLRDRRLANSHAMSARYKLTKQTRWYRYLNFIFHLRKLGIGAQ